MQRSRLGDLSRLLNRITGGERGKTLCHRWATAYGPYCLVCRVVGFVLRNPRHCEEEL